MHRLALFLLASPLLAQSPGPDIVLLLEKTPGMRQPLPYQQFAAIPPDDRVAVMTFADHSQVRQTFTSDPKKLEQALRQAERNPAPHHWGPHPGTPPQVRVFQSVLDAAWLFRSRPSDPGRGRVILTIFGTEDESAVPPLDEMRRELSSARIRLLPLPAKTLQTLQILATETGGEAVSGEANLPRILRQALSR